MLMVMRPEILFPLFAPITTLKGVGPKIEPLVIKLAGPLVRDLAFLSPQSLIHRPVTTAAEAVEGEVQTFIVTVDSHIPSPSDPTCPTESAPMTGRDFLL